MQVGLNKKTSETYFRPENSNVQFFEIVYYEEDQNMSFEKV